MATYTCLFRSNYFRVKDAEAFKTFMGAVGLRLLTGKDGTFGFVDDEGGGMPTIRYNEAEDDHEDIEFVALLAPHLADDQVCVMMEAGWEASRYANGYSVAVNAKGERIDVGIEEIYGKVKAKWGVQPTEASY
jgi:hypothetical protein